MRPKDTNYCGGINQAFFKIKGNFTVFFLRKDF